MTTKKWPPYNHVVCPVRNARAHVVPDRCHVRITVTEFIGHPDVVRRVPFSERLEDPGDDVRFPARVEGTLVLAGTDHSVCLTGSVRTVADLVCGACLAWFQLPLEVEVREEFYRPPDEAWEAGPAERELAPEDFLTPVEPGDVIDVTDVVRQNVLLALPLAPRCRDDCRGLCPRCGADRNQVDCGCEDDDIDPRLAPLRDRLLVHGPAGDRGRT